MITRETSGVYAIAATPFTETGALDLASIDSLVDFYQGCGVHGLTILGVMGEAPKLSAEESRAVIDRVLARARVPVVVGASSPGVANLAALSHYAMEKGAAGVMVAPIPGLGTEEALYDYFEAVCGALGPDLPVCLQDYPQLTGVKMSPRAILRLTHDFRQIVMLKHEDWPGLTKLERVRHGGGDAEDPRLSILCGNGGLFLPQEMARGADGAMTGYAYPEMLVEVVKRFGARDADGAEDLFDAHLPLIRHEMQPGLGLAIRKEILRRRCALSCAAVRAPGPRLTQTDHDELGRLITRMERRVRALG